MQRGEVWWADLPAPIGRRPAILVTRDTAYGRRTSLTVVPVTRTVRGIPVEVVLGPTDGLPTDCVANADDIMTVPVESLLNRITLLSPDKMRAVSRSIVIALALDRG